VVVLQDALIIVNGGEDALRLQLKVIIVTRMIHIMASCSNDQTEEYFLCNVEDLSAVAFVNHPVDKLDDVSSMNGIMIRVMNMVHFLKGEGKVAHDGISHSKFLLPVVFLIEELKCEIKRIIICLFVSQESIIL